MEKIRLISEDQIQAILDDTCKKCKFKVRYLEERGREERAKVKKDLSRKLNIRQISIECPYCGGHFQHRLY